MSIAGYLWDRTAPFLPGRPAAAAASAAAGGRSRGHTLALSWGWQNDAGATLHSPLPAPPVALSDRKPWNSNTMSASSCPFRGASQAPGFVPRSCSACSPRVCCRFQETLDGCCCTLASKLGAFISLPPSLPCVWYTNQLPFPNPTARCSTSIHLNGAPVNNPG